MKTLDVILIEPIIVIVWFYVGFKILCFIATLREAISDETINI